MLNAEEVMIEKPLRISPIVPKFFELFGDMEKDVEHSTRHDAEEWVTGTNISSDINPTFQKFVLI